MTSVSDVGSSYEAYLKSSRTPTQELGQEQFLALLVAQLQYQDPLEPMSDTDFVAQLAQFSSLTALQSLNDTVSTSAAYSLVGKIVYAEFYDSDTGAYVDVYNTVTSIVMQGGNAYAAVDGYMVPIEAILGVFEPTDYSNPVLDYANIMGKTVIGNVIVYDEEDKVVKDEDGEVVTKKVEGKVTRIAVEKAEVVAYIEDEDGNIHTLPVRNIVDIRN